MRRLLSTFLLTAVFSAQGFPLIRTDPPFRNGDIIFITNPAGQGKSIQLATRSKFTHVGIIFIENANAMVYHAVEPVSRNTVDEFIDMSEDGRYEIRRLKDQGSLTPEVVQEMRSEAQSKLGLHYDLAFDWSDAEMYCSEYVWKIYQKVLKIEIGRPRLLKEFDLSHPLVRSALHSRYGNNIPFSGKMISPGDMFVSPLVE